ncbi:ATP-binding protein [Pseudoxanthobacter sp. M-2]|uniref:sensor histidine kinase n=1 Tax=Pseudoxanthobacter sp. M-2 TaxID=3078754 RepID=UPI0038FCD47F
MTVRARIFAFEAIVVVGAVLMVAVMVFTLRITDDFVERIDGVHRRFEAIAMLDGHANNYAEQIAEVLLLGSEQMADFEQARRQMDEAFALLAEVTRAEVSTFNSVEEVRRELSDVEELATLRELYRAIDRAAEQVFGLKAEGRMDAAVEVFRRDVEYRLANDFENQIEAALQDERDEVAGELADVRRMQNRLFIGAGVFSAIALIAGGALGWVLSRSIVGPVGRLAAGAAAVARGELDHRVAVTGNNEFTALARSFNEMARALEAQRAGLVAARDRLEAEVEQRTGELRRANEKLTDIDRRRARFLADVSHELRTPLTILRGEAEVALRGSADAHAYQETLRRIQMLAVDMGRLLGDLLAFAGSEDGDLPLARQPVDVGGLLVLAGEEGRTLADPRAIAIDVEPPGVPIVVEADPQRLKQVLLIGIDNAVKYAPEGSTVTLAARAADVGVEITVTDEGEGVPEAERPFVFERFYRGEDGEGRAVAGLGIGLSIAKTLVERHGGRLTLEDGAPRGAVLRIVLPAAGGRVA